MALRLSFAVAIVPFVIAGCGDSKSSSAGSGGASIAGAGASSGGAKTASGGAAIANGGAGALLSGGATLGGGNGRGGEGAGPNSGMERGGATASGTGGTLVGAGGNGGSRGGAGPGANGGSQNASGGTHAGASAGGAANAGGSAGDAGAPSSAAGSGGTLGGIPSDWYVGGGVNTATIPGPNFDTVRVMFDGVPCYGSNCHKGGRNHFQVGKPPDELYTYMMSLKTLDCGKLIDTAHPSESALVKYLRGPCGSIERMPYYRCVDDGDAGCVPEYYIKAIEQWIANGAPR